MMAPILRLLRSGEKGADHQAEAPHLHEAGPQGEIQAGSHQQDHQGRTPDDAVQQGNDLLKHGRWGSGLRRRGGDPGFSVKAEGVDPPGFYALFSNIMQLHTPKIQIINAF